MKPILWPQHARDTQAVRPLSDALVEHAAREPGWREEDPDPDVERRFRVLPDGRVLRVACVETEAHIRIVTFHLDRNARRKRRR